MVKLFHLKEEKKMEESTINLICKVIGVCTLWPFFRLLLEELTGGVR